MILPFSESRFLFERKLIVTFPSTWNLAASVFNRKFHFEIADFGRLGDCRNLSIKIVLLWSSTWKLKRIKCISWQFSVGSFSALRLMQPNFALRNVTITSLVSEVVPIIAAENAPNGDTTPTKTGFWCGSLELFGDNRIVPLQFSILSDLESPLRESPKMVFANLSAPNTLSSLAAWGVCQLNLRTIQSAQLASKYFEIEISN